VADEYADRVDAGRQLAAALLAEAGVVDGGVADAEHPVVVLGLPRGGVPVAAEVARVLGAPLDVLVVRKVGVPWHPEVAMGAIGEGGVRVVDEQTMRWAGVSEADFAAVEAKERRTLDARVATLRAGRPPLELEGRTALIVDDGIATGSTARAAARVARALGAARVILAAPVAPADTVATLTLEADAVIVPLIPPGFRAVGHHYRDFTQTTDAEVQRLLNQRRGAQRPSRRTW
jgi:putative phosphoribosyl transferase